MLNVLLGDSNDVPLEDSKTAKAYKALISANKADALEGYVAEMLRIDPPIQGVYRQARVNETVGSTSLNADELVYCDIASANRNVSC